MRYDSELWNTTLYLSDMDKKVLQIFFKNAYHMMDYGYIEFKITKLQKELIQRLHIVFTEPKS